MRHAHSTSAGAGANTPAQTWHGRVRQALRHSVRARLVMVFLVLALVLTLSFIGGAQRMLSSGWQQAAKPLVVDYMDRVVAQLGTPPDVQQALALTQRLPITLRIEGPQVRWASHPGQARSLPKEWDNDTREPFWVRHSADGHTLSFGIQTAIWSQRPNAFWATLALLVVTTALAYFYVRRLLKPLDAIAAGAKRFGAGEFSEPIPLPRKRHSDELDELAQTVNTMGQDIQAMLEAKRAILLAISHELRSPLTRARLNAELLPETPEVAASRAALLRDLAEMTQLISDLLESERLHNGHAALNADWVDVEALLEDTWLTQPEVGLKLELNIEPNLPHVHIDAIRVRLLLRNLLSNASRYARGSAVQLRAQRDQQGELVISVRDHGPGVSPAHLQQLGQAFFRPDEARTRQAGGVGLGLYLCTLIMRAHGGRLSLHHADPGLMVSAHFPAQVFQRAVSAGGGNDDSADGSA